MSATDVATHVFMQMEQRKYASKLSSIKSQVASAETMVDLSRAYSGVKSAAHPVLRPLVRNSPERRDVDLAAQEKGEQLIGAALEALTEFRRTPPKDFTERAGRFIENYREPCRGDFPALYHKADRGLETVKAWRHQNLKTDADYVERPTRGEDLIALGYVFHQTTREAVRGIIREGFERGSFSRTPIDFNGDTWIAVHPKHLPPSQVHDYGGVQALEPNWDPEVKYSYDDDMNTIETKVPRTIPADKLILSDKNGKVAHDGTLRSALGKVAPSGHRFRR